MAETKPKKTRTFVHTEYKKGDEYHQILLSEVKKDRLYRSGKPNLSEADRRVVLKSARSTQKIKKLEDTVEYQREKIDLLTSGKENTYLSFPPCLNSYAISGEPSIRECGLQPQARPWINLPKREGIYVVDNPKKCERCLGIRRLLAQLQIESGKKVSWKDVLNAEDKKGLYQQIEETAKGNDNSFDEEIKKFREKNQRILREKQKSINETEANERTMQNGGNNKEIKYKTDAEGRKYFLGEFSQRIYV